MKPTGTLHLIPVSLGAAPTEAWLPATVREVAGRLQTYIAENAKTARAFLKQVGTVAPLQEITIHTLDNKVNATKMRSWLQPLLDGGEIGLVSEAGCPAVADPGARVVAVAHDMGIRVIPWVGPSSILLSLMASGLDGQRFAFHGYAPIDPAERARQIKAWEQESRRHQQTQLLIETPYRNDAMLATLKQTLQATTRLCVARALTTPEEWVQTHAVSRWKSIPAPDLARKPAIFLFQAAR